MSILLVEDNLSIIKGLSYSFLKNEYKLTYKTSVKETLEYLKDASDINLIILDVTLPDGNGFDLYEKYIKSLNIPTIFLTAKDDENDIVRGLDSGAEDYITKPFSTKELLARVNKILMRSKKQNVIKVEEHNFRYG